MERFEFASEIAADLMEELQSGKIRGKEEPNSHTDFNNNKAKLEDALLLG